MPTVLEVPLGVYLGVFIRNIFWESPLKGLFEITFMSELVGYRLLSILTRQGVACFPGHCLILFYYDALGSQLWQQLDGRKLMDQKLSFHDLLRHLGGEKSESHVESNHTLSWMKSIFLGHH